MSKSAGIITYHGLHNYGAMLQALALQVVVKDLGLECEIINFRTEEQKRRYLPAFKKRNSFFEHLVKIIFLAPYKSATLAKHKLFESFLHNNLVLSAKEYNTLEELFDEPPVYDYYISGSDQIWNPFGPSFNWAYYLPFVKTGTRISYAPSVVLQHANEKFGVNEKQKIKEYLNKYDFISVREKATEYNINEVTVINPKIVLDPTLLLEAEQWEKYINKEPIIDGDYLFYYSPGYDKSALKITRQLSKILNIKVVTSIVHSAKFLITNRNIIKEVAVGPLEFLNLCKNAKLIVGHSLHMVAFAIIFNKPFFVTEGLQNKRISHLLEITGLTNRSISANNLQEKVKDTYSIDYAKVNQLIKQEREKSLKFLTNSLK